MHDVSPYLFYKVFRKTHLDRIPLTEIAQKKCVAEKDFRMAYIAWFLAMAFSTCSYEECRKMCRSISHLEHHPTPEFFSHAGIPVIHVRETLFIQV